jgi:hypothetical protein
VPSRGSFFFGSASRSLVVIWTVFVLTHLWLGFLDLTAPGGPMGDVVVQYQTWAQRAEFSGTYVGINSAWVYPIVALVPMLIASVSGFGFDQYASTWLVLVLVLDLVAFAVLVGWRRPARSLALGWWWIAFLLLLGPIALARIDAVSVAIGIVAVLLLVARPRVAALLLTIATWIKVWPAALLAAVVIASKSRVRILLTVVLTSAVIIAAALAFGAGSNVFSFITQQTSRGLQIESPTSTIWMWMSFAHVPGASLFYNQTLNTFEVVGPQSLGVAALLTPVLGFVVLCLLVLGFVATRRGTPVTELLAPLALALVTAFIAFNKVGSPQYISWLTVPILLGLATRSMGFGRSFRFPAGVALVSAALTQLIYPYLYLQLLQLELPLLEALTLRNILVLVLFGWAVVVLIDLCRPMRVHEELGESQVWLPTPWPFKETARNVSASSQVGDASRRR